MDIIIPAINPDSYFPKFTQPEVVGVFSLDSKRNYIPGARYLKYFKTPKQLNNVDFDLSMHSTFGNPDEEEDQHKQTSELTHLLTWINSHNDYILYKRPDFVFYRGLMTKLLTSTYENHDGWKMAALCKNGTIYLRQLDTQEDISSRKMFRTDPRLRKFSSWGYAFEYFLLSDHPGSEPNPANQEKNECNMVFHSRLGSHNILYAAEIDGVLVGDDLKDLPVDVENEADTIKFLKKSKLVELKTSRQFSAGVMPYKFKRFNLLKWWNQSFTTGVAKIVVGYRDDIGIVKDLQIMDLKECQKAGKDWAPNICFNFLNNLLTEIKSVVTTIDDESFIHIFEFYPAVSDSIKIRVTPERNSSFNLPNLV